MAVDDEAFTDKIDIGSLQITDVPVFELDTNGISTPARDNQDCVLGMAALSRLDFVFDGPHNVAYLRAKTSQPAPDSYNRLGAAFVPTPQQVRQAVAWVIAGSPAYEAGIRNRDVLLQVDGIRTTTWSGAWVNKFELPAGTKLHLLLERNGTNFETVATLREILTPSNGGNGPMGDSKNAQFYYSRANIEGAKGDDSAALADYNKAIELKPDFAAAYFCRASAEAAENNIVSALADYSKAIELKPDYADAFFYRGGIKWTDGNLDGAFVDYNRAIELKSDAPEFYFVRANLERTMTNLDAALADYSKAIELKPDYVDTYLWRGLARRNDGDLDGALADFDRAIELDPTNSVYYNDRGWAEFLKRDFDSSITDATRSIQLNSSNGYSYGTRGWARYSKGDISGAIEDCTRASQMIKRGSAPFYSYQGLLDFIAKDYTEAIADWQNAIKQEPEYKKELQPWIEKAQDASKARVSIPSNVVNQTKSLQK